MESRVDTLMKDAISIMRRSENVFGISSDVMRQLPPEPSCQEAFEDLVMNFILYQEEKVKQLQEYMGVIGSDFMQLSLEVIGKLKEEIKMKENRSRRLRRSRVPLALSLVQRITEMSSPDMMRKIRTHKVPYKSSHHLSAKEILSVDEPEPQLLPKFSPLDVNLEDKRGTDPPIKPHSTNSFRMEVIFDEKKLGSS
ncbi:hypothetical protein Tco_0217522 [Tanacetum coccineum]